MFDMTPDAQWFVADTQAPRGSHSERDAAWTAKAVRVLDAANRIDPDVDDAHA